MSYAEQLKKPQWQKKRLETLQRDEWTCQTCGDTEATLTVHHKSYRMVDGKFVDVWDYEDSWLITLCEKCHSLEEACLSSMKTNSFIKLREALEDSRAMASLVNHIKILAQRNGRLSVDDVRLIFIDMDIDYDKKVEDYE